MSCSKPGKVKAIWEVIAVFWFWSPVPFFSGASWSEDFTFSLETVDVYEYPSKHDVSLSLSVCHIMVFLPVCHYHFL